MSLLAQLSRLAPPPQCNLCNFFIVLQGRQFGGGVLTLCLEQKKTIFVVSVFLFIFLYFYASFP